MGYPAKFRVPAEAPLLLMVSKQLGIKWDLHESWRLQSTGKMEKMNDTLKRTTAKICCEPNLIWDRVFLFALLRIRVAPRSRLQLSTYEVLCRRPILYSEWVGRQIPDQKVK